MVKFEVFGEKNVADRVTIKYEPIDFDLDRIIRGFKLPKNPERPKPSRFKTIWILHDLNHNNYYIENYYNDWSYEKYILLFVYDQKEGDITEKFKTELHARTNN